MLTTVSHCVKRKKETDRESKIYVNNVLFVVIRRINRIMTGHILHIRLIKLMICFM